MWLNFSPLFRVLFGRRVLHPALLVPLLAGALLSAPGKNIKEEVGQRSLRLSDRVDLTLPPGYTPPEAAGRQCSGRLFRARFFAARFAQGQAVYVEVLAPAEGQAAGQLPATAPRLYFDGRPVPLRKRDWGYRGFFGIGPVAKAGRRTVLFVFGSGAGASRTSCAFPIASTRFPVYRSSMDLGKFSGTKRSAADLAFIRRSSIRKRQVFARRTADMIRARMAHPRDIHKVTSPYYARRVKRQYRVKNGKRIYLKPRVNIHRGLDLKGLTGAPIFALLDGVVAAAEPMFWEGNHTILDHGDGIFTVYMHQSAMLVKAGQTVKAGDLIGRTGATGAVTGPHLHIALYMRGLPIYPLSFLSLPVRD